MSTMTALYGGGPFYDDMPGVIDILKASGFTTVVCWGLHVQENGDLNYNDVQGLVANGVYGGKPEWPGQLASLKSGPTGVDRLLFSVGGSGVSDFTNIAALIAAGEIGPGSNLYRNFQALRQAIPIDAIDLDCEEVPYEQSTIVKFSEMLGAIGYNVTFCPYEEPDFWAGCVQALGQSMPGLVTGMNLQCYDGGRFNVPADWVAAIRKATGPTFPASFVYPGCWTSGSNKFPGGDSPATVAGKFAGWARHGTTGGFIWFYDAIEAWVAENPTSPGVAAVTAQYAAAIVQGLGSPAPGGLLGAGRAAVG